MNRFSKSHHCRLLLVLIVSGMIQCLVDEVSSEPVSIKALLHAMNERLQSLEHQLGQINATLQHLASEKDSAECSFFRPRDCADIRLRSNVSKVYTIYVGVMQRPLLVYCDMNTDGGGWTVFQRRVDGSQDFFRKWVDYENGFGDLSGEFWLGNENIHWLTSSGRQYKLRIELADFNGSSRYAEFDNFKVGPACSNYQLVSVGNFSGTSGDSFTHHVGSMFTTIDRDNDGLEGRNCADQFKGGWWYLKCHRANLNGYYLHGAHSSYADGIEWREWTGFYYSLRFTEMKILPVYV